MSKAQLLPYDEYRTGLTFGAVFQMLKAEANQKWEAGERMFITRHTVLGRWHQIKRESYEGYRRAFYASAYAQMRSARAQRPARVDMLETRL